MGVIDAFFAWRRVRRERDDAFMAIHDMRSNERVALSTALVLRRTRRSRPGGQ
jgi:hypothetical protein